jgi:glycerol-3-phosphate acyltransferase PlsY
MYAPFVAFVLAYLLGSVPFGLVLTHIAGFGDIRKIGSGNIGATNVLRTGNIKLAALTLFLDFLKGVAAVLIAAAFLPELGHVAALGAVLGHMFPAWLKFKGGKGVATFIGVFTALNWPTGIAIMAIWLAIAATFRISSLAALVAVGLVPLDLLIFGHVDLALFSLVFVALIFFKHRENIRRLINHAEPKIEMHSNGTPPVERD